MCARSGVVAPGATSKEAVVSDSTLPRRLAAATLAALLALPALSAVALAASASYTANCSVNLRASTSTSASVLTVIPSGTVVTASGSVSGGSWSAGGCAGSNATGSSWYAITAVNGKSTSTLYGKSTVYAATGLFTLVTAPSSSFLEGVDVSTWQGTINYAQVYAAGKRFVIAKATEGIGFTDGKWATNRANAPAAGLALGAYHFARPDLNATTSGAVGEADWFVSQMNLTGGMLIPALDLEVHGTLTVSQLTAWVQAWLGEVYAKTGTRAMIYTSPSFWRTYLGDTAWFAQNGYSVLWVAHWTTASSPSVPASNWGGHSWTFWQYADNGTVPGIGGGVDLDRYNGADLTKVTYGADFDVAVTGTSTKQTKGVSTTVGIARDWFSLPVSLAVTGLPASVTSSLAPTSTTGSSSALTLTTTSSTPVGSYPFTVTGTSNGVSHATAATLVVTDGFPPTVKTPVSRLATGTLGTTVPVQTTWSASDPSGISGYKAERQANGGSWGIVSLPSAMTATVSQGLSIGPSYRYIARATDGAGNTSAWAYGPTFRASLTQQTSSAVVYGGTWRSASSTVASGGSLKYATAAGAWASYRFTGRSIAWVAFRGPTRGSAAVYIDGVYKTTISLYAASYHSRPIVYSFTWASSGTHTIKIVVKGTAGHPRVDLDAFIRLA